MPYATAVRGPARDDHAADSLAMRALLDLGQSVWLDRSNRRMTRDGELAAMVRRGLRGVAWNAAAFEQAVTATTDYDEALASLAATPRSDRSVLEELAIQDTRDAADVLRRVFDTSGGVDGFATIAVAPDLARDAEGTVEAARRLWRATGRPNVMIEIPATRESGPAIEHALREGINIAVTLLFSAEQYRAVAAACMRALEDRAGRGDPIDRLAVIASLPVSRIDEEVDARIDAAGGSAWALRGRAGIASARLLYGAFLEITRGARWRALEARGARVPRPLWASTETRNPDYYDVRYLESLIGPSTVTSVLSDTLRRFEDHGFVRRRLPGNVTAAKRAMRALTSRGIDIPEVRRTLETRAIDARTRSFERALVAIAAKRRAVRTRSSTETHDPAARRGCERGDPFMRHIAGPDGQAAGGPSLEP